jgi:hypothetical protein
LRCVTGQVPGVLLAVDQHHAVVAAQGHQACQGDLDASRWTRRTSIRQTPPGPATQYRPPTSSPPPRFPRCARALAREVAIGLHHDAGHDPGAVLPGPRAVCAILNDRVEGGVDADLATGVPDELRQCFAERAVELEVRHLQDHAGVRAPPEDGLPRAEPRKRARPAHRLLPTGLGQGRLRPRLGSLEGRGHPVRARAIAT